MKSDERRMCIVDDKAAAFHCWTREEAPPVYGIVEYLNGDVELAPPQKIKFCDTTEKGLTEWKSKRAEFLKRNGD